jgi:23S rRNA (guanine745-N1)-methyltransferase
MPLADVLDVLACPVCEGGFHADSATLGCAQGHRFDIARGGTITLADHRANLTTADTSAMVDDRAAFYDAGHYDALIARVVETVVAAAPANDPVVVDAGAGTGHLLAAVLTALVSGRGIALDTSKPAVRMAARRHPKVVGVVADLWRPWPIAAGAVDVALTMFAPRNPEEVQRVLRPGGLWIVVLPIEGHLAQLRDRLTLLGIPEGKVEDVTGTLPEGLTYEGVYPFRHDLDLARDEAVRLVRMGPNRHHVGDDDLKAQAERLEQSERVTQAIDVVVIRRS